MHLIERQGYGDCSSDQTSPPNYNLQESKKSLIGKSQRILTT